MKIYITVIAIVATIFFYGCGSGQHEHNHSSHDSNEHYDGDGHNHDGHDHDGDDHDAEKSAKEEHSDEIAFSKEQAETVGLEIEPVATGTFAQVIKTSGQIKASQGDEATIAATSNGVVSFVNPSITEGTAVRAGEAIVSISAKNLLEGDPA
ncbi:MAG: efflux transporter periplasmic adaptor subunit, partial [Prevotellaceae bacterium]|nr:efflux transporter periplasmic adaptor subunit [Prevotellaceae bacterium]